MKTIRHSVQSITGEDTDCMTDDTVATKCLIKIDQESLKPSPAVKLDNLPSVVNQTSPQPPPHTIIKIENSNIVTTTTAKAVQIFTCSPCGIRFSSLSTLSAHQTYYCSQRQKTDSESDEMTLANDTDSRPSSGELTTKSIKSGNHYKCSQCSYSAEKKGSLTRHMRMHFTSPVSAQSSPCPPDVADLSTVDRYCQSCDIRFSNLRTYQAHKTHYCSTRHAADQNQSGSPAHCNDHGGPSGNVPAYLALPTSPVIIVPYALVQNARALSALPTSVGPSPPTDAACIVQTDGTLHPVAQSIHRRSSRSRPDELTASFKRAEVNGQENKRPTIVQPLDLRLNRGDLLSSQNGGEEEKENRGDDGNDKSTRDVVVVKQAMLLPYYTHEMLSKLKRKRSSPPARQQFFFNRGQSKCDSCNIVFCKYTNYLAHKTHYCASRSTGIKVSGTDDADKTSNEPIVSDLDIIMEQDCVQSPVLDENTASPVVDVGVKVPKSDAEDTQNKVKVIAATNSAVISVNDDDRPNNLLMPTEHNRPLNCRGPSTSDQTFLSPAFAYRRHSATVADQPVNGRRPMTTKQCKTCDISFNCLSTFIAHRKYYCRYNGENSVKNTVGTSATYYN